MKTQEVIYKVPGDGNGPVPVTIMNWWLQNHFHLPTPCMRCGSDLRVISEALDVAVSVMNQLGNHISELPEYSTNPKLQEIHNDLVMHMKSFSSLRTGIAQTSLKAAIISEEMGKHND